VFETIYENRLNYTQDLVHMGADIKVWDAQHAMVKGPTPLKGREVDGPDIRAGLAFLIAAIIAKGNSTINNAYYIDRGYADIENRLKKIGVSIERTLICP
jgi:UDP-N-acetylglucosamine 1-carboxyvinyltransferase